MDERIIAIATLLEKILQINCSIFLKFEVITFVAPGYSSV